MDRCKKLILIYRITLFTCPFGGFTYIKCYSLWKAGFFLSDPSLFMAGTAKFRSAESESFILVGENSLPPSNIFPDID